MSQALNAYTFYCTHWTWIKHFGKGCKCISIIWTVHSETWWETEERSWWMDHEFIIKNNKKLNPHFHWVAFHNIFVLEKFHCLVPPSKLCCQCNACSICRKRYNDDVGTRKLWMNENAPTKNRDIETILNTCMIVNCEVMDLAPQIFNMELIV